MSGQPRGGSFGGAAAAAVAGVLAGCLIGAADYGFALRREMGERRDRLSEVAQVKLRDVRRWLRERDSERQYFSQDPDLLADYARAGDPEVRHRLADRYSRLKTRHGMESVLVYRGGRLVFRFPADAAEKATERDFDFVGEFPGGRVVFRFSEAHEVFQDASFWPRGDMGFTMRIVRRPVRPSAPEEIVLPIDEMGWSMVGRFDPAHARLAALVEAIPFGVAGAAVVAAVFFLLLAEHRRRLLAGIREVDAERLLLSQAVEQAAESVVITDDQAVIQYVNPAFSRVTGYSREEAVGRKPSVLKSGKHDDAFYRELWATLARGETWRGRLVNKRKDGRIYEEEASIAPVRGEDGRVTHYIAVKRDASQERQLQDQMRHAQKMEAVGRIAGGVAHDFNNILTAIIGYTEMAAAEAAPGSQIGLDLAEVLKAARLAASLSSRLLTFSRRQIAEPTTIDLSEPVRALEKMLRRTLGENVVLRLDLDRQPIWVRIDPAQVEQALLNLAINARDAMPNGGGLRVTTASVDLPNKLRHGLTEVPAGRWARLSVVDDGTGMAPEVLDHLFEPFFTTKEKGRGTGLGLSTVFGIVTQNGGHVAVDSAPGSGSVFTVYLPVVAAPQAEETDETGVTRSGRAATLLLVEDQDEVRNLAERVLRSGGYSVLPCRNGREALAVEASHRGSIEVLLTDVIMPDMGGVELSRLFREKRPEARVLFMSGYTDQTVADSGVLHEGVDLLPKPFTPSALLERVARTLADETRAAS